jgi:hypothetical protein
MRLLPGSLSLLLLYRDMCSFGYLSSVCTIQHLSAEASHRLQQVLRQEARPGADCPLQRVLQLHSAYACSLVRHRNNPLEFPPARPTEASLPSLMEAARALQRHGLRVFSPTVQPNYTAICASGLRVLAAALALRGHPQELGVAGAGAAQQQPPFAHYSVQGAAATQAQTDILLDEHAGQLRTGLMKILQSDTCSRPVSVSKSVAVSCRLTDEIHAWNRRSVVIGTWSAMIRQFPFCARRYSRTWCQPNHL